MGCQFSLGVIAGFSFSFWVTGELSTLRQMMKVPNEPGLSPNNGLENAFLSDQSMASNPRKGQAKRFGAKTTSHDSKAGHVMTHVCHRARQEQRQVRPCKRDCSFGLSTLRQMMEVPNEPGLSPNNGSCLLLLPYCMCLTGDPQWHDNHLLVDG